MWNLLLLAVIVGISASKLPNSCRQSQAKYGINCECTEEYCDSLKLPELENRDEFLLVTSSEDGERFSHEFGKFTAQSDSKKKRNNGTNMLFVDQTLKFNRSEIIGFGGAWTGAVRHVLSQFNSFALRKQFYDSYFSAEEGLGYNLLRIPIGGVDFELEPWTYDDQDEPDLQLLNFTELNAYDKLQNEQIKEMQQLTNNFDIKIFGAAWSPPRWMKAKHQWNGKHDNQLIKDYYQTFADYHARWLNLTIDDGIPVWSISTGNEPIFSVNFADDQVGNSWKPQDLADWMMNYLVKSLQKTNSNVKIHMFDDCRNGSIEYINEMIRKQPNLMQHADFIGMHPYFDHNTPPEILDTLYEKYDKQILYTEMSFGVNGDNLGPLPGAWSRAEELIVTIIEALQHDVAGYVDWNLILDSKGGPAYIDKSIDAPILANEDFTGFYKQPMYYAMAHFSKFISRHSVRIASTFSGSNKSKVKAIAYQRPDNRISVVLYNNGTDAIDFILVDAMKGDTTITIKPKSLNTIIYRTI